jgi:serine/threonine protein kinase
MSQSIDDFTLMTVIGKGTYAKVLLVKHKKSEEIYAMKILKKKHIAEKKQEEHIKTERTVLANMDHPFLTKMFYSFQDAKKLYFVLEYCPGGELFGLLQSKGTISE